MNNFFSIKRNYNVCFSLDDNYSEQLATNIASILKNSSANECFNFFILNNRLSDFNKKKINNLKKIKNFNIKYIGIDTEEFKDFPLIKDKEIKYKDCSITLPAYFKYKFSSLFKNLDKILYLDCDLIVLESIKDLYNVDLGNSYAAMAEDFDNVQNAARFNLSNYFNSGVMLVNLKKWRQDNIEKKLFDITNKYTNSILWADQDVFNIVFENNIKKISGEWNFQFFLKSKEARDALLMQYSTINIIHFAGKDKPWTQTYYDALFDEYYKYLVLTDYKIKNIIYQNNKYKSFYDYLYAQIDKKIVEEHEYIYNFLYSEISERVKKEMKNIL